MYIIKCAYWVLFILTSLAQIYLADREVEEKPVTLWKSIFSVVLFVPLIIILFADL